MLFRRLYTKTGGLGMNRLEALSDGVFGVAITLLVLAIVLPQLSAIELHAGGLFPALFALWPKVLVYAASFFVIGIYWMGHNIMFSYIERSDRVLIILNILLLMSVSFIAWPIVIESPDPKGPRRGKRSGLLVDGVLCAPCSGI